MSRILTKEQIREAKELKRIGYTKRQLARYFEVAETTIWDNVFSRKKRIRKYIVRPPQPTYRKIGIVIQAVTALRNTGLSSQVVSNLLSIPLKEINYIYAHNPPENIREDIDII